MFSYRAEHSLVFSFCLIYVSSVVVVQIMMHMIRTRVNNAAADIGNNSHRKTRLIPLTGGPKPPSSVCVLVTVGYVNT